MTILSLRRHSRGLGISTRRSRRASAGPPGDTVAPSIPQNLVATTVADGQIDLTWDASTDNVGVTGYKIYRDNVLIDTSPINAYSDAGLSAGEYEYEVSASDAAGNESARSDPAGAVTPIARLSPEFVQRGTPGVQTNAASDVGFTYPAEDVHEDDLFLAVIVVNDRGAAPDVTDTASGWTRLNETKVGELAVAVFYKRATGSESGAVTPFDWSSGNAANDVALCQVYQYRYVDWESGGPFVGSVDTKTGNLTSLAMPSVTTEGVKGLAVAVVGASDDGNVGTPSGQTGGTWIDPRDRDNTTSADDAAVTIFQAALASPGTISGGSVSFTPTTPQSSRSAAIGLALRGMVDPQNYSTLSVSIAASADDARENTGTSVTTIADTVIFALSNVILGTRFTGLAAIKGKTIVQANIQYTAAGTDGFLNNGTYTLKGEAADSAAQYAAVNGNISGRSLTTASRTWRIPSWVSGDRTIRQRSVDVRAIVQEISDRPGFGGVVNLIGSSTDNNSRQIAAWDHATLQEATLTVRYLP